MYVLWYKFQSIDEVVYWVKRFSTMQLTNFVAVVFVCIFSTSFFQLINSYRILGVFPTPSLSHHVVFRPLTLKLNEQGHELVIITSNPLRNSTIKNYTEIDVTPVEQVFTGVNLFELREKSDFFEFIRTYNRLHSLLESIYENEHVQKLYDENSGEKFDLMIVETLYCPGVLPLAKRFGVPVVGITSIGLAAHLQYAIGNPVMGSHPGNWESKADEGWEHLTFWQRFKNFTKLWYYIYWYETNYLHRQEEIARKYLGNDYVGDLRDHEKNVSLIFVNQQGPISYLRPSYRNLIDIGGLHVSKKINHLPNDLKEFLDEAKDGFVYMSLGSNIQSTDMPKKIFDSFRIAFAKLPYKVLWKFEDDEFSNKPDNVRIMNWVPQQAVLAHPNLKAFIYQGGLQSTEEAVAHAVPLVGIPIFTDQDMQVNKMVSVGVAIKLEITTIDGNELYEAISKVASDESYKERMINLRSLINDKPHDILENAVWWTEYVIRHKGAHHLRSTEIDQPWYSRQDFDIVAFISIIFVCSLTLLSFILVKLVEAIHNHTFNVTWMKKLK